MLKPIRKHHPAIKVLNGSLIDLPAASNLSIWWNFGSLLGLCLVIQVATGIFLAIHYTADVNLAFSSVAHITRDVNYGWLLRNIHANGASCFFVCLYLHIGRGIYYSSYLFIETWNTGVILLCLVIATSFLGYVLVWGQISFWAATVITNLVSAAPYVGTIVVEWLWGGFAVDNATLTRFFTFHFVLPFAIIGVTILHILFLHQTGSNNPLGLNRDSQKVPFHTYYTTKDLVGFILLIIILALIALLNPTFSIDPENFIPANPLVTPVHIQPEWYFLFAYAILRAIPNKLGGVIALLARIFILLILPFSHTQQVRGTQFYPINQILFWSWVNSAILLTWIGARPVEAPYDYLGAIFTCLYFSYFFIAPISFFVWDKILLFKK